MIYILQNIIPISAATIAGLLIGAFWLRMLGLRWPRPGALIVAVAAEFWLAAILAGALILAPSQAGVWVMTVGSAVVIWCGFVLPVLAVTLAAGRVRPSRIISAAGYWLVTMIVQAALMRLIGLVAPPA